MPYIKDYQRENLSDCKLEEIIPANAGELNYVLTRVCNNYITENRGGLCYQKLNDVMGALTGVQFEMYRRVAAQYEDHKCVVNGEAFNAALIKMPVTKGT